MRSSSASSAALWSSSVWPPIPTIPIAGLSLLIGIDRFMSEARAITNLIGNALAAVVIARWDGALNVRRMRRILDGETVIEADEPEEALQ